MNIECNPAAARANIGITKDQFIDRIKINKSLYHDKSIMMMIDHIADKLTTNENLIWLKGISTSQLQIDLLTTNIKLSDIEHIPEYEKTLNIINAHIGGSQSLRPENKLAQSVNSLTINSKINIPTANIIPAIRQVSPSGAEFDDYSGKGLIEKIAQLQNPAKHGKDRHKEFNKINNFLQSVLEKDDAKIEIPHDRSEILVHMDDRAFPLAALGTGIHEVVMLASFCTLLENQILCIEEPETHLHPALQRRLINYLQTNTSNQYFIATHSASIIDASDAAIFHVKNLNGKTTISKTECNSSKHSLLQDLGYKASDLLQTNCIIWVEGPSDRIYLNHWIQSTDTRLVEGLHYSIMFYGGRLLSHLTTEESNDAHTDIKALIAVQKLNQNLAFVIDSDRADEASDINSTKLIIKKEIKKHGGICWITAGREIENYIPQPIMHSALSSAYDSFETQLGTEQFDHVLPFRKKDGTEQQTVDKVKIARTVTQQPSDFTVADLKKRMDEITNMIRTVNHLDTI